MPANERKMFKQKKKKKKKRKRKKEKKRRSGAGEIALKRANALISREPEFTKRDVVGSRWLNLGILKALYNYNISRAGVSCPAVSHRNISQYYTRAIVNCFTAFN